VLHVIVKMLDI